MMDKYDADKDGKLSEEERNKMMEDFRKMREANGGGGAPDGGGRPPRNPDAPKIPVPGGAK